MGIPTVKGPENEAVCRVPVKSYSFMKPAGLEDQVIRTSSSGHANINDQLTLEVQMQTLCKVDFQSSVIRPWMVGGETFWLYVTHFIESIPSHLLLLSSWLKLENYIANIDHH